LNKSPQQRSRPLKALYGARMANGSREHRRFKGDVAAVLFQVSGVNQPKMQLLELNEVLSSSARCTSIAMREQQVPRPRRGNIKIENDNVVI